MKFPNWDKTSILEFKQKEIEEPSNIIDKIRENSSAYSTTLRGYVVYTVFFELTMRVSLEEESDELAIGEYSGRRNVPSL